jgi:hypothetical protein
MKKFIFISLTFFAYFNSVAQETASSSAKVLFKSAGDPKDVLFHTSTDSQPCEGLTRTAGVYDAVLLRKNLLPLIARALEKTHAAGKVYPEVEVPVQADVPLQILGQSNWSGSAGQLTEFGQCGPFTQQFQPQAGHRYLVQFTFTGKACSQSIQDISNADAPAAVETVALECKRPMFK